MLLLKKICNKSYNKQQVDTMLLMRSQIKTLQNNNQFERKFYISENSEFVFTVLKYRDLMIIYYKDFKFH